jgi:hypothetical protein
MCALLDLERPTNSHIQIGEEFVEAKAIQILNPRFVADEMGVFDAKAKNPEVHIQP